MSESMKSNPMDLVEAVCQRARGDEELKAALLADPRGTLQRETGLTIPDGWDLAGNVYLLERLGSKQVLRLPASALRRLLNSIEDRVEYVGSTRLCFCL